MTAPFLSPGFRATDSDDNPLAGGYINFYAAGTTTPKAVYSDADLSTSLGTTVNLNSAGAPVSGSNTPVLIYPGLGDYKIRYYDADDMLIFEFDDYPGGVAEVEESTTGLPIIPVDSKTTAYTVVEGDRGNLINCNPTGGAFAVTLPSAVTMGDNFIVGFRHNGTANQVSLVTTGGQSIRGRKNVTSHVLANQGDIAWLISDGSDWIVAGSEKQAPPFHVVIDSLTTPPVSPIPGAKYRINGTPTGAWSSFADEDIAEADGNGSWFKHTPSSGWLLFDQDTEEYLKFTDGAWGDLLVAPAASTLKTIIVQDQKSSGTDGGTPTQDAWTTAVLNTAVVNTIDDSSLASNKITLPAGRYRARARKVFAVTGKSRIRLKKDVAGTVLGLSESIVAGNIVSTQSANASVGVVAVIDCEFELAESTDIILEYYVDVNQGGTSTQGLGIPSSITSTVEVYATVVIEDLAAQQGPQGPQGASGAGSGDFVIASNNSDDITEGATNLFLTVAERAVIASQWTTVEKTTDETIQSDTTLGADAALVFAMDANTRYRFRAFIFFDTGATGDFKWRHSGPASPTLVRIKRSHIVGAGTAYAGIAFDSAYSSGDIAIAGAAGTGWIEFEGIILNGVNAGNFEFQWAQNATEAVDTTVRAGSYIEYRVVA